MANVVTIPAGARFLHILAREVETRFGDRLDDALILLPTRRAVRELAEIFTGDSGARILPRMRPLGDIDPDEPPFEPGYLTGLVKPSMPGTQRRFQLASLIGQMHKTKGEDMDPAAQLSLTEPLIAILNDAAMEEIGLDNIDRLDEIQKMAAKHFQEAASFYEILQKHWPEHLAEKNVMEPMARRVALLHALTNLWEDKPPDHPVIIAGSTGTLAANARLMGCVSKLDEGLIVLPGLDKNLKQAEWDDIRLKKTVAKDRVFEKTPEHPQFALKKLITHLGVEREKVPTLGDEKLGENPRLALISEALVPADATAGWPERIKTLTKGAKNKNFFEEALDALSIIECRTDDEEAMTIALVMREAAHIGDKTVALVTPDPSLARRVKARLRRWNINVDYSQGEPLEETSLGSFLASILNLARTPQSPLEMAALFKHPLTGFDEAPGAARQYWLGLEKSKFRRDLEDAKAGLQDEKIINWLQYIQPLTEELLSVQEWTRRLVHAAEQIATINEQDGAARLWCEDTGKKAAKMIEELITYGGEFGKTDLQAFSRLFGTMMRGLVVRPPYGTHPRLKILGPLEARMLNADTIVLGGLNEGIWPARPPHRPFLSRGMRAELGLSLPERRLGLAAHDFQQLASNPNVILTRAQRSEDGPRVASRWLWRLKTLGKGGLGKKADKALEPPKPYHLWARNLDFVAPDDVKEASQPAPMPPIEKRWPRGRKLSVTKMKVWIRDPYAIYGQFVLGLNSLGGLTAKAGPREYGIALHDGIEAFFKDYKNKFPPNSEKLLTQIFVEKFTESGFEPYYLSREHVRLERIATDLIALLKKRGIEQADTIYSELLGRFKFPDLDFTVTGKPDLVEKAVGTYTIFDFKTGAPPGVPEVSAGFDPQMPLLATMVEQGAFKDNGIQPATVVDMQYIQIKGVGEGNVYSRSITEGRNALAADKHQEQALKTLSKLVKAYDKVETPYYSQPRVKYKNDYGDYDLLARRAEWAKIGEDGGGNAA